ncbi:MAG: hypothetical protein AAGA20_11065 [Planctomycetota bacterium]
MARKKARSRARDPLPEDALRDLAKRLESDVPSAVLLRGEERYFRTRGIALVVDAAREAGMEICRHDPLDPEYAPARLVDDLATGALFQSARCVVLESAERVVVDRARNVSPAARDAMLARLETGAPGCIVLSAEKLRADHVLAKAIQAAGGPTVGCRRLYDSPPAWNPDPRSAEIVQWCAARAKALGVPIEPAEALTIVAATGNDLAAIDDQLRSLVGRGAEALRDIVAWDAAASVWDVAEHVAVGDVKRAALGIESLFASGAVQRDGSRVIDNDGVVAQLAMALSAKLREAERAASVLRGGGTPAQAIAAAGVRGPKAAHAALEKRIAARPHDAWPRMLADLGALERRSRSSVRVDATDFMHFALQHRRRAGDAKSRSRTPRMGG